MIDYRPDQAWPPAPLAPILGKQTEWHAWWSGDPTALQTAYSAASTGIGSTYSTPGHPHVYSRSDGTTWSGGVMGAAHRLWWGQPVEAGGSARGKLHIPLAADIATASADLLFGDELTVTTSLTDTGHAKLLEILDGNNLHALLVEAAERQASLGEVWLRVVTDPDVSPDPIIDLVDARRAIPTYRWGRLVSVQFWHDVAATGNTVWRHVEEYTAAGVEHALFEGSSSRIGVRRELTLQPATADLAVNEASSVDTGGMAAFGIPNRLPIKGLPDSGRGASDFDGVEPLFDAVDEAWASLMRDVRLGKARIIVPQHYLDQPAGPGSGGVYNLDRELMVGVNAPGNLDTPIVHEQFNIRSEDHMRVIDAAVRQAIHSAGYSAASFGIDTDGAAQTATEVRAKRERTLSTRERKTRYWTNQLEALVNHVARRANLGDAKTVVEFPQAVTPSQLELANVASVMLAAQAASTRQRVQVVHPDWADDAVDAEAALIDRANSLADPLQVGTVPPEPMPDLG